MNVWVWLRLCGCDCVFHCVIVWEVSGGGECVRVCRCDCVFVWLCDCVGEEGSVWVEQP